MLKIRLSRRGKKKSPFYRINVVDMRQKRDGAPVEQIGTYDPFTKALLLNKEKANEWIKKGAIPSSTVRTLLKK